MLKQAVGFALWGAAIAVLGAALGMSTSQSGGYYGYVAGMSFVADGIHTRGWSVLVLAAVAGGVAGCATGVVLTVCGIGVHSNTDSRVGRVVAAGIAGIVIGVSPSLIVVGRSFTGADVGEAVIEWLLLVYAVSAVLGYFAALVAVHLVLRVSGDTAPYRVVRAVAVALPVGAVIATATGMGVAWMAGYSTSPYTFVAVIISVLLVLAATFAVACARAHGGPMQGSSRTPLDR